MLRLALCDDEPAFIEMLSNKIQKILTPGKYQIAIFFSAGDFSAAFEKDPFAFDLIFLDVCLEENSAAGIPLAEKINRRNSHVQIIFISQYLEYASDAYQANHVWYIDKSRLDDFLEPALNAAIQNLSAQTPHFLTIKVRQTRLQIPQDEILYLERCVHHTKIYTSGECYMTREKLSDLQSQLAPSFVTCHRSFVIHLPAVSNLRRTSVLLVNGREIPVSRSHFAEVKSAFAKLLI